ncbi:DUF6163 family protein [Hansschlegelia sp.]|uniref:DUF6163 family protein n=1 Tax=Hansschlegelia sp. TaxID=2041892 RepID=UPI002C1122E0|nr:DUF6163 family protein [Hansschlegelia sp.]HVI28555.1 DUF6163 family protein [Hansschlegelia sp.]
MTAGADDEAGLPGISLRDSHLQADRVARPWSWRLVMFLRGVAVFELVKGLVFWGLLIGSGGSPNPLEGARVSWFVACTFFVAADPVAAVGLWLATSWGVVIWLLAALGQLLWAATAASAAPGRWFAALVSLALIGAYIYLSMRARREVS